MKTITKALIATATAAVMATSAHAANFGNVTGEPYVGVKVGSIDMDDNRVPNLTSYGVYAGYNFTDNFGVEADYSGTEAETYKGTANAEIDAKTYGLYGTYRYNFGAVPAYVKAKVGVAKTKSDLSSTLTGDDFEVLNDTRLAGGIGAGYKLTDNIAVEAMYNKIHSDVDQYTAGVHLSF